MIDQVTRAHRLRDASLEPLAHAVRGAAFEGAPGIRRRQHDRRQRLAEFVRETRGHFPQRREPCIGRGLGFRLPFRRDVRDRLDPAAGRDAAVGGRDVPPVAVELENAGLLRGPVDQGAAFVQDLLHRPLLEQIDREFRLDHLLEGHAGPDGPLRQAKDRREAVVRDQHAVLVVVEAETLRHVVEREGEPLVRLAQIIHGARQGAVQLFEFLGHQRHGAVGAAPVALRLLIGVVDEFREPVDVDRAIGRTRLVHLAGQEAMHGRCHQHGRTSASVATVIVWLCSRGRPAARCGANSP